MASNHKRIEAKSGQTSFTLTQHETDSPLLPVQQLERLQSFCPERVDWVFNQTEIEASHRRLTSHRVQKERETRIWLSFFLGLAVVACGTFLGTQGHDWLAGTIVCSGVLTLAAGLLKSEIKR
jgi:hypothetical protein